MKYCSHCHKKRPNFKFHKSKRSPDGLDYNCKDCDRKYQHKWTEAHPDKRYDYTKKWSKNSRHNSKSGYGYGQIVFKDRRKGRDTCSKEEFYSIVNTYGCLYCGFVGFIGADRIDNSKGHTLDNILPCCDFCNIARSDHFTVEEMLLIGEVIRKIRIARGETVISLKLLRKFRKEYL